MAASLDRGLKLLAAIAASVWLAVFPATAQEVKQIKLSDAQVQSFIKAQSDLAAIASKIQAAGEKPTETSGRA